MRRTAYLVSKRVVDFAVALTVGILIAPLLAIIALAVAWNLGRPIFYRQRRCGLNGREFEIIKFRTMRDAVGPDGHPLPDAERLTRFGAFLRSSSLDELPELWNVLVGEMSIVGPRPLLPEYMPLYSLEQARRHDVRPGLTGWAQVNGRNALSWDDRFELDVWYVDHQSWLLDLRIIVRTVITVLGRQGISHEGEATMAKFTGSGPGGGQAG